jgi:hypothetical protein
MDMLVRHNGLGSEWSANPHDVAEAVAVKLRHRFEVCGEDLTVSGFQSSDEWAA